MPDRPARPPEAEMIKGARERLRLSIPEAAAAISRHMIAGGARSGLSAARLRQIEAGYLTQRAGVQVPTAASAAILAHAARFYGITPDDLKSAGKRPDAAKALKALLASAPAAPEPATVRDAVPGEEPAPGTPQDRGAWDIFPGRDNPNAALRTAWRLSRPEEVRLKLIAVIRAIWALGGDENERLELIWAAVATVEEGAGSGSGRRARTA